MIVEFTFSNAAQASFDLEPGTVRKVSFDPDRPFDSKINITFKNDLNPIVLFFRKNDDPQSDEHLGPFVSFITFFLKGQVPLVLSNPFSIYEAFCSFFLHGQSDVQSPRLDIPSDGFHIYNDF